MVGLVNLHLCPPLDGRGREADRGLGWGLTTLQAGGWWQHVVAGVGVGGTTSITTRATNHAHDRHCHHCRPSDATDPCERGERRCRAVLCDDMHCADRGRTPRPRITPPQPQAPPDPSTDLSAKLECSGRTMRGAW